MGFPFKCIFRNGDKHRIWLPLRVIKQIVLSKLEDEFILGLKQAAMKRSGFKHYGSLYGARCPVYKEDEGKEVVWMSRDERKDTVTMFNWTWENFLDRWFGQDIKYITENVDDFKAYLQKASLFDDPTNLDFVRRLWKTDFPNVKSVENVSKVMVWPGDAIETSWTFDCRLRFTYNDGSVKVQKYRLTCEQEREFNRSCKYVPCPMVVRCTEKK
jgi:hypothetical protein